MKCTAHLPIHDLNCETFITMETGYDVVIKKTEENAMSIL